jgi:hypothetical protein
LLFIFVILFSKTGIILKGHQSSRSSSLREDPVIGYTYIPNTKITGEDLKGEFPIFINKLGFREPDFNEYAVKSANKRVMILGDSFTFASGVREPFTDIIKSLFKKDIHKSVAVLNFGLPGFSTHNQIGVVKKYGYDIKPEIIVLAFYLGNDFRENLVPINDTKIINGYLVNNTVAWAGKTITLSDEELKRYSNLATKYHLSAHSMMQIIKVDKFGSEMTFIERTMRQLAINFPQLKVFTDFVKQRLSLNALTGLRITVSEYYGVTNEEREITKKYLSELVNECRKVNSTLVVTIIPEHLGDYDNRLKREAITKIIKDLNIQHYIDLFPYMSSNMDEYYSKKDDHLSPDGHVVVAESIVDYIRQNNLL